MVSASKLWWVCYVWQVVLLYNYKAQQSDECVVCDRCCVTAKGQWFDGCVMCDRWWCCTTTRLSGLMSWRYSAGTRSCCCTRTVKRGGWGSSPTASRASSLPAMSPWPVGTGGPSFVCPLHQSVPHYAVLYWNVPCHVVLYCTVPQHAALYCSVPDHAVL